MIDIYQHFRKEEEPFIDQVLSWKERVEKSYQYKLTDFLDPREQQIVKMLIGENNTDVKCDVLPKERAERKRVIIAPFYDEMMEEDFQLTLLEATYPVKFTQIQHKDVMGSFLSLGIERKKLGDIVVDDGIIQLITANEITPYITANLTSIKKATVQFKEVPLAQMRESQDEWEPFDKTVSSLRLDAVMKEIYHLSRKDASDLIKKSLVKVNHRLVDDSKFTVQEGDLVSVRGKGRSKLIEIQGKTRKEKWRITAAKLK